MNQCSHTWVPETYYRERCVRCDEVRQRAVRYVHQQSGEIVEGEPRTIETHDIHGGTIEWTPIEGDDD